MGTVSALSAYLAQWRGRAFAPGHADCALFAAGWLALRGGPDLAAGWAGRYATVEDGLALLAAEGFAGLPDLAADAGLTELSGWMQARVGDIAFVAEGGHLCAGLVGGAHVHVLSPLGGLEVVPLDRAVRVFRP